MRAVHDLVVMTDTSREDVHVSTVFVEAGYDVVWILVSDPLNFPDIYPSWTSEVTQREGEYAARGPGGDEFLIHPELDRGYGVVDFEMDLGGVVERSRSRLFGAGDDACVLVHVAVRWEGVDDDAWRRHREATDSDLERMKEFAESVGNG